MYQYSAMVARVIDGDTVVLDVDLGFNITIRETVRLLGINAPELHASDPAVRAAAERARGALVSMLDPTVPLTADTEKPYRGDKYGRMLATLTLADGTVVNQWMVDNGYAVPYFP